VAHSASVGKSKICLPPLHEKLGFIKIYVKAMDKESEGFGYLRQKFSKLSETKKKEGVFVDPQIKTTLQRPRL
jgi:exonuclease VII large subunit